MFHVVQYFDAAKSVAVVPQSWYSDGFALWPAYTNDKRINKAVQCAETPAQDWTRHPVKVLKGYGQKNLYMLYFSNIWFVLQIDRETDRETD